MGRMNLREKGKKILRTLSERFENGKPWSAESMKRTNEFLVTKFMAKYVITDG